MGRFITFLFMLAFFAFAWMTYDNVWSPIEATQALAEAAACAEKDCTKHHGVTQIERRPYEQTFQFTWSNGSIVIKCQRESFVFGPRKCVPE
jgi:hypothetical protein